jgi:uncharacterized membrane protein
MASPTPGKTQLGLEPNIAGLLCYAPCCLGLVFSLVVVIVEKQSRFVKFHAFQSLLLHGGLIVLSIGLTVVTIALGAMSGALGLLMLPVRMLLGLGVLGLLIFLMIKANANEEFALPVIGDLAKNWSSQY